MCTTGWQQKEDGSFLEGIETGTAHGPVVFDCSGQGEPPYAEDTL